MVQFLVDNFVGAALSGSKTGIESERFSGQHTEHTTALLIGTDWIWDTWTVHFWVESSALASVLMVCGVTCGVCDDPADGRDIFGVSEDESTFDDARVLSAFFSVVGPAVSFQITKRVEIKWDVGNGLSIAIGDSVGLGVHFDAFVSVDQFSATFVNGIDNLTVCEDGWPVDQYLVGVSPSVIEVTPATVSVDWCKRGFSISGEGSAGYVGVRFGIASDV